MDDLTDVDPALAAAVLEIEGHVSDAGWDQPARLYALVDTVRLVDRAPDVAASTGLAEDAVPGSFTAVEQDQLRADQPLETVLEQISWPEGVSGCAAVVERLVLPPDADRAIPDGRAAAEQYAREHPERQEVRIVAGATRAGATYCALRLRAHDDPQSVVTGVDLVPALLELLTTTLETDDTHQEDDR